jgi:hypothetical protein
MSLPRSLRSSHLSMYLAEDRMRVAFSSVALRPSLTSRAVWHSSWRQSATRAGCCATSRARAASPTVRLRTSAHLGQHADAARTSARHAARAHQPAPSLAQRLLFCSSECQESAAS